jgi:Lrp/AsnC family transcriptional regulator for asnA, asnC and gidA
MTELDHRIIAELESDPLISSQALADRLSVTRGQVITRLRFIDTQEIAHVIAQLDTSYGGYVTSWAYIKVRGRDVADVAKEIAAIREVLLVATLLGEDDIFVTLRAHGSRPQKEVVALLSAVEGVAELRYDITLSVLCSKASRMSFSQDPAGYSIEERVTNLKRDLDHLDLDDLDISIIAQLQHDGRARFREIARNAEVTEGAIRYRVKNLQARGLLSIITAVDPVALDLHIWSVLALEIDPGGLDRLMQRLRVHAWLVLAVLTTGAHGLRCTVLARDQNALGEIIAWIRSLPEVRQISPQNLLRVHKLDRRFASRASEEAPA